MRYKAVVKYNGAAYFGWQKQINETSVQATIENRLSSIFNEEIIIHGSGRTDAKVHALGQVFHFDAKTFSVRKLKYALNRMLPSDIEIVSVTKVPETFHARFSAIEKVYEYVISTKAKDPFLTEQVLFYPFALDVSLLQKSAQQFIGTHNFQNFTSKHDDDKGFIRTISDVSVKKRGTNITITFKGSGFMRGQVRVMVGTLLSINEGKINSNYIIENLNSTERKIITYKASGSGLYLLKVLY